MKAVRLIHLRIALAVAFAQVALAQAPVIDSIVNAASVQPVSEIAPQMWIAILGQNLAASAVGSSASPLPQQLGGTSVTFNDIPASLNYVSPTQINAQVPSALSQQHVVDIVVVTGAGASTKTTLAVTAEQFGLFTQDGSGCGQANAYNIHPDGTIGPNTPNSSLDPTTDLGIMVLLTGLGYFADRMDGVPWQFNADDNTAFVPIFNHSPTLSLGMPGVLSYDVPLGTVYSAPAPDRVGTDQVNGLILTYNGAPSIPQGCKIPLYMTAPEVGLGSQFVNVSVRNGGGACVDPSPDGIATFTWQKNYSSTASGISSSDSFAARILEAASVDFPPTPAVDAPNAFETLAFYNPPLFCAASYPSTLNAGPLTVSGPGIGPVAVQASTANSITSYQLNLPANTIKAGNYTVSVSNGLAPFPVPFTSTTQVPDPISITTNLSPGTNLPLTGFSINWTGGDDSSIVTVQVILGSEPNLPGQILATQTALGSQGSVQFSESGLPFGPNLTLVPRFGVGYLEITIIQEPANPVTLPVAGLTRGAQHCWKYVFDYQGLSNLQPN